MATKRLTLDDLPAEMITRIASFAPCESVINLLQVNRKLHSICNDTTVFKTIIENRNMKPCAYAGNVTLPPMEVPLHPGLSTSDWMRLALADSRARDWFHHPGGILDQGPRADQYERLAEWLPQLLALSHPLLTIETTYQKALLKLPPMNTGYADRVHENLVDMLSFCNLVAILKHAAVLRSSLDPEMSPQELSAHQHVTGQVYLRTRNELRNLDDPHHGYRAPAYLPGVFACALLFHCHTMLGPEAILPPSPEKVPLWALMGLQMPFSGSTSLSEGYLKTLTSATFLEEGEWVGYYSSGLVLVVRREIRFDPPMHSIRFNVLQQSPGIFELQADGIDNVGTFTLRGHVQSIGKVSMVKTYAAGLSWRWDARMTPFGIIGAWGSGGTIFGNFWIWKKEWSPVNS